MNEFEQKISSLAKGLDYPSTPDISADVMKKIRQPRFISRRLAWSLTLILILLVSLFAIPPVRAAIIEFIQIGMVRIFPQQIEPTIQMVVTATPLPKTPIPTQIPFFETLDGKMTLEQAGQTVPYPILLPTYPSELGKPDLVFVQEAEGYMTILVWVNPEQPNEIEMSLHLIPLGSWAIEKIDPQIIQETEVNGQRAIWAVGYYALRLSDGDMVFTRLIEGNVLIWESNSITYRLETNLSMEEAILIAENLQPIP